MVCTVGALMLAYNLSHRKTGQCLFPVVCLFVQSCVCLYNFVFVCKILLLLLFCIFAWTTLYNVGLLCGYNLAHGAGQVIESFLLCICLNSFVQLCLSFWAGQVIAHSKSDRWNCPLITTSNCPLVHCVQTRTIVHNWLTVHNLTLAKFWYQLSRSSC